MYDNICKFLAQEFSNDLATWLLGSPTSLIELSPTELSSEPIRADSLILQQSENLVLHIEFQTKADPEIPFRMIDYRLRVYRKFPKKQMRQIVIYLQKSNSDLVQQNYFSLSGTRHEFQIIRLWEQPTEIFLNTPGLLPFAVLSRTTSPKNVLNQVATVLDGISERRVQSNLAAASAILAGLVLKKKVISQILRSEIMRESAIYQEILQEGEEKGRQVGLQEGRQVGLQEAKEEVAVNLLKGNMTSEQVVLFTGLSLDRVQSLKTALDSSNH